MRNAELFSSRAQWGVRETGRGGATAVHLDITLKRKNIIVRLAGELDHHNALKLKNRLDVELSKDIAKNIILNLRELKFMDSSGLGFLLGRYQRLAESGGATMIAGAQGQVRRVFELSGLTKIIPQVQTLAEALKAVGGES